MAAWTLSRTSGNETTTTVQASTLAPSGSFGPPEDIATATANTQSMTGAFYSLTQLVTSGAGAADALIGDLEFLGVPGEVAAAGLGATRQAGAWSAPEDLGGADALQLGAQYSSDIAASGNGAALYVDGSKPSSLPTMRFSARLRPHGPEFRVGERSKERQ